MPPCRSTAPVLSVVDLSKFEVEIKVPESFARDLGIPSSLDEAAQLIAGGKQRRVDVAELNGRVFINNSAIGLYPLMVAARDAQRKRLGRSKRLAMLVAGAVSPSPKKPSAKPAPAMKSARRKTGDRR